MGYFTNGRLSDGEVFTVISDSNEIEISVGTERFADGDTILEAKVHKPGKKGGPAGCWVSKWVNN